MFFNLAFCFTGKQVCVWGGGLPALLSLAFRPAWTLLIRARAIPWSIFYLSLCLTRVVIVAFCWDFALLTLQLMKFNFAWLTLVCFLHVYHKQFYKWQRRVACAGSARSYLSAVPYLHLHCYLQYSIIVKTFVIIYYNLIVSS